MPGSQLLSWLWIVETAVGFIYFSALLEAAPEFSGYLQKVLKNQTAHACDGKQLTIICPHRTSIVVLSAFYGRRVPSQNLCPTSGDVSLESTECASATARQKMMDECQDQRWCHFSVHSRVFGPDPCPGTHKYLVVSYKCRPANHRLKTVCEDEKLRLQCRNKSVLAIYSAVYGRPLQGKLECYSVNETGADIECVAPDALRRVSRRCHRKQNCTILANKSTFGDPCFPGVKKQLRVSYTCVPRKLLEEVGHDSREDPFAISDYTHGVPEKVGFYFLCGVSGGLVLLLLLFVPKVALLRDFKEVFKATKPSDNLEMERNKLRDEPEEETRDDSSSNSSFRHLTNLYHNSNNIFGPELTAALEGAVEQRGHEGEEIWIPKESSPYAIHKIKSATK
ncbi:protein eva-1 homolog C isoform X2 [Anolis carolinensis]|uniref:protein eva-1 homolog C isoform X2 n=1 Tax=Anolis carolinensis TaxID=28377 RepID=UPI0007DB7620|nr:PREDICTED: protein eva-1 homolog C isoform X2 [Anolis carolinensis]|eukprot:XP_016853321.1 PREDICTED: protein eva-1 homolog C isoform X2 [Anolis carolinensis]